jgi:ATP-dependent Clp protease ATP-binding subunit ClpA
LAERGVTFELTPEATSWLAIKGYDEKMGARPLSRVIQEHIKKPLAEEVLFGKLKTGGTVKVSLTRDKDGKEVIALEAIEDKPPTKLAKKPARKPPKTKASKVAKNPKAASSKARDDNTNGRGPGGSKGSAGSVPKVPLKT